MIYVVLRVLKKILPWWIVGIKYEDFRAYNVIWSVISTRSKVVGDLTLLHIHACDRDLWYDPISRCIRL